MDGVKPTDRFLENYGKRFKIFWEAQKHADASNWGHLVDCLPNTFNNPSRFLVRLDRSTHAFCSNSRSSPAFPLWHARQQWPQQSGVLSLKVRDVRGTGHYCAGVLTTCALTQTFTFPRLLQVKIQWPGIALGFNSTPSPPPLPPPAVLPKHLFYHTRRSIISRGLVIQASELKDVGIKTTPLL